MKAKLVLSSLCLIAALSGSSHAHAGLLDLFCFRIYSPKQVQKFTPRTPLTGFWKNLAEQADQQINGPDGWTSLWQMGASEGSTLGKSRLGLLLDEPSNPVIALLKESGSEVSRRRLKVSVEGLMDLVIQRTENAVQTGEISAEDAIWPGGVFQGANGERKYIRWGVDPVPGDQYLPDIHDQSVFMEAEAHNIFPIGGTTRSANLDFFRVGSVFIHDLFHVIGLSTNFRYMAAVAQGTKALMPVVHGDLDRIVNPHSGLRIRSIWVYESLESISKSDAEAARAVVAPFLEAGDFEQQSYAKILKKFDGMSPPELEKLRARFPKLLMGRIQRLGGANLDPIVRLGAHHELFQMNSYAPGMWLTSQLVGLQRTGWLRREDEYLKKTLASVVSWVLLLSRYDAEWWVRALLLEGPEKEKLNQIFGKGGAFEKVGWESFLKP